LAKENTIYPKLLTYPRAATMAAQTSQSSTKRSDPAGDPLGPYRRFEQIGKGSFATVFKGTHPVSHFPKYLVA